MNFFDIFKTYAIIKYFFLVGGRGSDTLKAVEIPLVSRKECFESYDNDVDGKPITIVESQICAGTSKRDACQVYFIFRIRCRFLYKRASYFRAICIHLFI